jgi:hypothetical protein
LGNFVHFFFENWERAMTYANGHDRTQKYTNNNKNMATARESDCASSSSLSLQESMSENEVLEQSSMVEAYSNEPLASSGDELPEENETDDEDGIPSATLAQRYDREVTVESW